MEYSDTQVHWTEEQWNRVQQTVRDEARKVRVAASFLPLHGPLPPDTESVSLQEVAPEDTGEEGFFGKLETRFGERRAERREKAEIAQTFVASIIDDEKALEDLKYSAGRQRGEPRKRLMVDDSNTRPLTTISVNVYLRRAQVAQPDLSSALIMFRRAANIIARVEDRIVFMGQPKDSELYNELKVEPRIYNVTGGKEFPGLIKSAPGKNRVSTAPGPNQTRGEALVQSVATGMTLLEDFGYLAPFALVFGSKLFVTAHTPEEKSMVLPADRIKPLLDGPLLRSSTIEPDNGVLVSLAGDLVDLVVARDISVQFVQITMEPRYVYRVSQRFTLRVKQCEAIVALLPEVPRNDYGREGRNAENQGNERNPGGKGPQRSQRN